MILANQSRLFLLLLSGRQPTQQNSRECGGLARDRAKVTEQVRILYGSLHVSKKAPVETLQTRLEKIPKGGTAETDAKFLIIHSFLLMPLLGELTAEHNLVHRIVGNTYKENDWSAPHYSSLSLYRERPKMPGFWNWMARIFVPQQEVLRINFNQMWCCRLFVPSYYITAATIKDQYNEKLKAGFGNYDWATVS